MHGSRRELIAGLGLASVCPTVCSSSPGGTSVPASFNVVTVLSIPFMIEKLVPHLVAALAGDPTTTAD